MDRQFDLSFTCGMMGVDYDDMDFTDYSNLELRIMLDQIIEAQYQFTLELQKRGL